MTARTDRVSCAQGHWREVSELWIRRLNSRRSSDISYGKPEHRLWETFKQSLGGRVLGVVSSAQRPEEMVKSSSKERQPRGSGVVPVEQRRTMK